MSSQRLFCSRLIGLEQLVVLFAGVRSTNVTGEGRFEMTCALPALTECLLQSTPCG